MSSRSKTLLSIVVLLILTGGGLSGVRTSHASHSTTPTW